MPKPSRGRERRTDATALSPPSVRHAAAGTPEQSLLHSIASGELDPALAHVNREGPTSPPKSLQLARSRSGLGAY